jgi:hypothetical protein
MSLLTALWHAIYIALLNVEALGTSNSRGNIQDRSAISRYFSHQIMTQVVQYGYGNRESKCQHRAQGSSLDSKLLPIRALSLPVSVSMSATQLNRDVLLAWRTI